MKDSYPSVSLIRLCRLLGVTRQAYYQFYWHIEELQIEEELVLNEVKELRRIHPVIGTRKLYCMLQSFLLDHQIKMGRDALFNLMSVNKFILRSVFPATFSSITAGERFVTFAAEVTQKPANNYLAR